MTTLGMAALQLEGAADGNLELFEREVESVARRFPWVQLVVGSELFIHGVKKSNAEPAGGPTEQRLQDLARRNNLWIVPGSLYEDRDGKIFNTTPIISPAGDIVARFDKMFPFLPYEAGIEPGRDYVTFDIPGAGRIGIAICYDMWFPEVIRTLAAQGAEVILLPTMTNTIDRDVELSIARANAAINQCYFIDVNGAGEQANGRSVYYGPGGELLHESGTARDIVALELDFEQVRRARARGWNGLGQVLKSFRDAPVRYPLHSDPQLRRAAMAELGALELPQKPTEKNEEPPALGQEKRGPGLKIVE